MSLRSDAVTPAATFRDARAGDLATIMRLIADDPLGKYREEAVEGDDVPDYYRAAFAAIMADPQQRLIVLEVDGAVHGCLQLTFIPGLTYKGLGKALIHHAAELARERGCALVQLTTDKRRQEAQAFYRSLGFAASHEGMKLWL